MALGNNLKKKKLIPDAQEEGGKEESKKKAPSKKKSVAAKKTAAAKPSPKKKQSKKPVSKKAAPKAPAPAKKPATKQKQIIPDPVEDIKSVDIQEPVDSNPVEKVPEEQAEPPKPEPTESAESAPEPASSEPLVVESAVEQVQKQETDLSNPNQIISAYSVYIAKELYERKSHLRKKYIEEIATLQGKSLQFIVLSIGGERYALDIDTVKEVVPLSTISNTPNTPDHIKGVANVRGNTYVVFDLAAKFQVKGDELPRYLLVLANRELKCSVPLSVLPETFRTNGSQISHSLQMIENALLDASYIKGMIQDGDELLYYLDIEELLKNDKAIVVPDNLVEEK